MLLRPGQSYVSEAPLLARESVVVLETELGISLPSTYHEQPPWEDGWTSVTEKGRITKRISKWMRDTKGKKLNDYDLQGIGDACSKLIVPAGIRVEISDKVDWNPGDFGDEESCFFRSRRQTLSYLHHLKARAIKFYSPSGQNGRCLVVDEDRDHLPVAFNFYGIDASAASTILMAMLASQQGGQEGNVFKRWMPLEINSSAQDPVWINKSHGYMFGIGNGNWEVIRREGIVSRNKIPKVLRGVGLMCEVCHKRIGDKKSSMFSESRVKAYVCESCHVKMTQGELGQRRWSMAAIIVVSKEGEVKKPEPAIASMGYTYNIAEQAITDAQLQYAGDTVHYGAANYAEQNRMWQNVWRYQAPVGATLTMDQIVGQMSEYEAGLRMANGAHADGYPVNDCVRQWATEEILAPIIARGFVTAEDYYAWAAWDRGEQYERR